MQRFTLWAAATVLILSLPSGAQPPGRAERAERPPRVVRVTNLRTGQQLVPPAPAKQGVRDEVVVFDTMTSEHSSAHLNVAYSNPGSYDGSDPSTVAFIIPLAERASNRALSDAALGFPLPTDILWNDYAASGAAWPGGSGGAPQPLASFSCVPYIRNTDPPVTARTDRLQVRFFSADGRTDFGGFTAEFFSPAGQAGYAGVTFDLTAFDPPLLVPSRGLVMADWIEPNNAGVGCMFTGGDLLNPAFPRPESLWTTGTPDPFRWSFADGLTGAGGPPATVDPGFDGDPSGVSYLDVLNTGAIADWQFTLGNPATHMLPRDFACRLAIRADTPSCRCDVNGSGDLNSQDFFEFVAAFFAGNADFNQSGATNSQDFFDFLACFFAGC